MSAPAVATVTLSADAHEMLTRPIVGNGGHQRLLRKVLSHYNTTTRALTLLPQHRMQMERYANAYGEGGYQGRFRAILADVTGGTR